MCTLKSFDYIRGEIYDQWQFFLPQDEYNHWEKKKKGCLYYERIFIILLIFVCLIVGWYFMMQYVFIWSHVVDYDKTAPKLIITKQFIYKGRVIRWCKEGIHIMGKYDLPICIFYDIGYVLNTENDCMKILDKCILKKDHVYFNKNDVNCKWWFYRATYTNVEE